MTPKNGLDIGSHINVQAERPAEPGRSSLLLGNHFT
jgi:hypothetical protein